MRACSWDALISKALRIMSTDTKPVEVKKEVCLRGETAAAVARE
jgi:hypothetical protein